MNSCLALQSFFPSKAKCLKDKNKSYLLVITFAEIFIMNLLRAA